MAGCSIIFVSLGSIQEAAPEAMSSVMIQAAIPDDFLILCNFKWVLIVFYAERE